MSSELKKKQKEFRSNLFSTDYSDSTVKSILSNLEKVTGCKPAHVAKFLKRSPATINNWIEKNDYIETIISVARYIKMQWSYENRAKLGIDED